ncbi:NTP transferase domain-containing protein [Erythrobacter citreus]|uniref:NTP transferase domain-containing protein n=1 Tax=Qipengyuania citrea TaxID=225971 RepID=A0A6I4UHB4_9SPHN|nr:nucleotidyltransferase family protein [Qipengyuania citrea]MDQ0567351.1 dTDP-glucose pyrophosphorylase [Qipengyuania citrea]MXP36895.1 NTP transferase domain-containing protein [Qipengyuania citrea]
MSVNNWRNALLGSEATIGDAIHSLNRSALQIALVIDGGDRLIGTITDGDVRRGMLRGYSLNTSVREVLHHDPLVVPPDVTREVVRAIMSANRIQQLPIVGADRNVLGLHLWDEFPGPVPRANLMVVMAGGKGTRLRPLTENCPKPMLPVAGKPILEHIVERAKRAGIERFVFSIHYLGHMIEDYFGDGAAWGVEIGYLREERPLGTGGALSLLQDRPTAPFLVTNGDVMTEVGYGDLVDYHMVHGAAATMAVRNHELKNPFGVVHTNGLDITGFEEKPIVNSHVNAGIYVIDPSALDCLEQGEHCDMPTLFGRLRDQSRRTIVFPLHEQWLDVGRPDDLNRARLISH